VIGLANVVIALYFYLGIVRRIYVVEPRVPTPVQLPTRMRLVLMVSIVALIAAGVAPQLLTGTTEAAVAALGLQAP